MCTDFELSHHSVYDAFTAQKMKFFIKDLFSKCDQIRSFLQIWSHLLKKSLMENFIFLCSVFYHYSVPAYRKWSTCDKLTFLLVSYYCHTRGTSLHHECFFSTKSLKLVLEPLDTPFQLANNIFFIYCRWRFQVYIYFSSISLTKSWRNIKWLWSPFHDCHFNISLHKKLETVDLVKFTEEILNGKLYFLFSVYDSKWLATKGL